MPSRTAAIFVHDDALADSLLFLLGACGLDAVLVRTPRGARGADILFADHRRSGLAFIDRLRALGWQGRAVLLTEDAAPVEPPEDVTVLEKPFAAPDVMAILTV